MQSAHAASTAGDPEPLGEGREAGPALGVPHAGRPQAQPQVDWRQWMGLSPYFKLSTGPIGSMSTPL